MAQDNISLKTFPNVGAIRTKIAELGASAKLSGKFTVAKLIEDGKKKIVKDGVDLENATVIEAKTAWFKVEQSTVDEETSEETTSTYWIRPTEYEGNPILSLEYDENAVVAKPEKPKRQRKAKGDKDDAEPAAESAEEEEAGDDEFTVDEDEEDEDEE